MVLPSFARLAILFGTCAVLGGVVAAPVEELDDQTNNSTFTDASVPSAPHFVIYSDQYVSGDNGPPPVSQVEGYNVFALSFLLDSKPADKAQEWASLSQKQRSSIKGQYAAKGIKLIVSAFGETDLPTNKDPVSTANFVAKWVKDHDLDGVDVDYEDFNAMESGNGKAERWLVSFTKQLRTQLPQGQYILSHAPVAPWFSPGKYHSGAYLTVHKEVGDLIDWYNIQFYNQGKSTYTNCETLVTSSGGDWPKTSVLQIHGSGIPFDKIVIGKPAKPKDADNGYIDPQTLAGCLKTAKDKGWNGGAMVWEFPDAAASWIKTVRSESWPV